MTFTVVWRPSARAELQEIWLKSPDPKAVADAARKIESILKNDPDKVGEPFDGKRVLVCTPLMVAFKVDFGDCMATVLKVVRVPG